MTFIQRMTESETVTDILPLFPWFTGFIYYKKHELPFLWMTILFVIGGIYIQYRWDAKNRLREHQEAERSFEREKRRLPETIVIRKRRWRLFSE